MKRSVGRVRALATAPILALSLAAVGTAPATASTDVAPASPELTHAAGWLAGQLVDGERIVTVFGGEEYDDHGVTADTVLALAAAKVAANEQRQATDWLEDTAEVYATPGDDIYAGSLAKLLVVAETMGRNARSFGDLDLVATLEAREQVDGRFTDLSEWGDYSNTITQSLALIGLHRVDGTSPSPFAVGYLVGQACEDGGFPIQFDQDPCVPEVDATAFATQALAALGHDAAEAAAGWLADEQLDDGSFIGDAGPNSNSTGLAAAALRATGYEAEADAAVAWIDAAQLGCDSDHPGALPYAPDEVGDVVRATTQALPGALGTTLADIHTSGSRTAVPTLDCSDDPTFSDVDPDYVHATAIHELAARGVLLGRTDGTFDPTGTVTRAQLASVVRRAGGFDERAGQMFRDVTVGPHVGSINGLAAEGIVRGYADGRFRPSDHVRRDHVAALLERWLEPEPVDVDAFRDVATTFHRDSINALAGIDVARGDTSGRFRPASNLTRAQLASFVWRAVQYIEDGEVGS